MFEMAIDRDMYDHPGKATTMTRGIRKYQNRPALAQGETVTIVRMTFTQDNYGLWPRVLVRSDNGERWVAGSDIEPIAHTGNNAAFNRMGEIASAILQ